MPEQQPDISPRKTDYEALEKYERRNRVVFASHAGALCFCAQMLGWSFWPDGTPYSRSLAIGLAVGTGIFLLVNIMGKSDKSRRLDMFPILLACFTLLYPSISNRMIHQQWSIGDTFLLGTAILCAVAISNFVSRQMQR